MTYLMIKYIIERKLAHQKIGFLTRDEVTDAADKRRDTRSEKN